MQIPDDYTATDCPTCGCVYYARTLWLKERREKGTLGYCPNGHPWSYKESQADQLRRERDLLNQRLAEKDDEIARQRRELSAARGQIAKIKNRVGQGVCPCCNRTFANLHRHMHSKHPDYAKNEPPVLAVVKGDKVA